MSHLLRSCSSHRPLIGRVVACSAAAVWLAANAAAQFNAFELRECGPYDSPLLGAGWRLPDERPKSNLPAIDLAHIIDVPRIEAPPVIDGQLRESIWAHPLRVEGLRFYDTREHEPARTRTVVRFLRDEEALYIGVTCYDSRLPSPAENETLTRQCLEDDALLITLDPEADLSNPLNLRYYRIPALEKSVEDRLRRLPPKYKPWRYATRVEKGKWTAEIRLDWWGLEVTPNFRDTWLVNIARIRSAEDPRGQWTPFAKAETRRLAEDRRATEPFERNSAWAPFEASDAAMKEQMPRLKIEVDFSPYLWSVSELRSDAKAGEVAHQCSTEITNHSARPQTVDIQVTAHYDRWKETHTQQEATLAGRETRRLDLGYALETPTTHGLSLAIVDLEKRRVLRRSRIYYVKPTRELETLRARRLRDERAHASFTLTARRDLRGVTFQTSDLFHDEAIVFARQTQVRSIEPTLPSRHWRIDSEGERAYIALSDYRSDLLVPRDRPFDMDRGVARQFWLTVDQRNLPPGTYEGTLTVSARGVEPVEVPVAISVESVETRPADMGLIDVWENWESVATPETAMKALASLGASSTRLPLQAGSAGDLIWREEDERFFAAALEAGIEPALAPPSRLLAFDRTKAQLTDWIRGRRRRDKGAVFSLLMPARPIGAGLLPTYEHFKKTFPDLRLSCEVRSLDAGLAEVAGLVDDWRLGSGGVGESRFGGAVAELDNNPRWRSFVEDPERDNRFYIVHAPSNERTAGQTACRTRTAFWAAGLSGLSGVTLKPAGREHTVLEPTQRHAGGWFEFPANGEIRLTRTVEAMRDGAADMALLARLREEIGRMRASERLDREKRQRLESLEWAMEQARRCAQGPGTEPEFEAARDKIINALLGETAPPRDGRPRRKSLWQRLKFW